MGAVKVIIQADSAYSPSACRAIGVGPDAGEGPGSVTLTITSLTMMSTFSAQARLRCPTLATCQLGEVAWTSPVAASGRGVQGRRSWSSSPPLFG